MLRLWLIWTTLFHPPKPLLFKVLTTTMYLLNLLEPFLVWLRNTEKKINLNEQFGIRYSYRSRVWGEGYGRHNPPSRLNTVPGRFCKSFSLCLTLETGVIVVNLNSHQSEELKHVYRPCSETNTVLLHGKQKVFRLDYYCLIFYTVAILNRLSALCRSAARFDKLRRRVIWRTYFAFIC